MQKKNCLYYQHMIYIFIKIYKQQITDVQIYVMHCKKIESNTATKFCSNILNFCYFFQIFIYNTVKIKNKDLEGGKYIWRL